MASNLVITPTALTVVTGPDDGDLRSAASVRLGLGQLANAVALYSSAAPLADLVALAAITTPANGFVRMVRGLGWYEFRTTATTGLSPFRVAAADATAGGWLSATAYQATLTRYLTLNKDVRISTASGAIAPILAATGLANNVDYAYPTVAQAGLSDRGFYTNIVYSAGAGSYRVVRAARRVAGGWLNALERDPLLPSHRRPR